MDICFKNEQEGVIVGAVGMILRTGDGGDTWVVLPDRIDNLLGNYNFFIFRLS